MPLYSDLGYYLPNNSVYSANRSPISSSPYSPYSRLNPYTLPPARPNIYAKDVQFKPMLTSISESPVSPLLRSNGLTSLTRMNSGGKSYSFLRTPGSYVSPRPIRINTADIDVSATRFHMHRNHRVRSTSPEQPLKYNDKDSNSDNTDGSVFMPRVDQNDPVQSRSTIKRDRNIVRLSTMRQRSESHSNRSSRDSMEKSRKSDHADGIKKANSQESTDETLSIECDTKLNAKKSWRDKFGDSLQTNEPKVARKTPGELILERHIIRDKNDALKVPLNSKPTIVRIPDNVTSQEITYLEPLIRKSIRRQSLISCPSFKDICKDISSDIKAEDDLNAGPLRRRASLILEQEGQIIAQLTSMRRPSADVTVDETIDEEPASPDEKDLEEFVVTAQSNSSNKVDIEINDGNSNETPKTENVIVIKKKTKKKGGKLKHKITVTVEVDNSSDLKADLGSEKVKVPKTGTEHSVSKTSPTWRAVVEDVEEDVTLNLPKKIPKKHTAHPVKRCESGEDFWSLMGRRESIYLKKKVDLKRNEIEIVEFLDENEKPAAENTDHTHVVKKSVDIKSQSSSNDESTSKGARQKDIDSKTNLSNTKTNENRQENIVSLVTPKKKPVDTIKTVAPKSLNTNASTAAEKRLITKTENTPNNTEKLAKIEMNQKESRNEIAKTATSSKSVEKLIAAKIETPCHEHKQTEKTEKNYVKADTKIQAVNLNIETRPQANKETKTEQLVESTTSTTTAAKTTKPSPSLTTKQKQNQIIPEPSINIDTTKNLQTNDSKAREVITVEKPASQEKDKKASDENTTNQTKTEPKAKPKKKITKNDKNLKSISSVENEINAESTDADTSAASESIALTETIEPKLSDHGNDNESKFDTISVGAAASQMLSDAKCPFGNYEAARSGGHDENVNNDNNDSSVGTLSKFATVANLNADFEIDRKSSPIDLVNDRTRNNNKSTFSTRSIADSCISGGEQLDLLLDFLSDSDSCSDSASEDEMGKKRRPKKRREKLDSRKVMKLDPKRKCYISAEVSKYPLIATPRPLVKRSNYCGKNYGESESESETSSDLSSSDECYDECLSPNDIVVKDVIRMSTCSNDSGFEGGTATPSPKKMLDCDVNCHKKCQNLTANLCGVNQKLIVEALTSVRRGAKEQSSTQHTAYQKSTSKSLDLTNDSDNLETSYTYAQFQRSGTITAPATAIPRFKKYSVDDFHFLTVLGKGSFGKVLLAELKNTEYYYAVKCLKKDVVLEDDDVECTLIERKVLALGTKHPYLCHLFCTFQTESHLFFVMEYLNGGDLMFHIQVSGRFPEPRAKFYAAEIVSGLKFLHKKGIIYRDLKLDNILLDFDGHVRIADFGMCKLQIYLDRTADSFCGTPDYMAPEIVKGQKYNQHVDWWSFGVLLYEMLIGQSPFSGCDEDELFWSICNEIPWYPFYLSKEALNILSKLLEKDPSVRLGASSSPHGDVTENIFFYEVDWKKLEKRQLEPPFKPKIKHPLDTQYFDKTFTRERVRLTPIDKDILQSIDQHQFQGFTYTNPNTTPP